MEFKAEPGSSVNSYTVEKVSVDSAVKGTWIKNEASKSESADLSSAKFVVIGRRDLKTERISSFFKFSPSLWAAKIAR